MRILHVLSAEFFAGSVAYAVQLAEAHRRAGHAVWLASDAATLPTEATLVRLPISNRRYGQRLRNARSVRALVQAEKIDVVHCHSRAASWVSYFALRGLLVPLVSTVHGRQHLHASTSLFDVYGEQVIAICGNLQTHLVNEVKMEARKIVQVPNGVAFGSEQLAVSSERKGGEYENPVVNPQPSTLRISFIGRFNGGKGERAAALLQQVFPALLAEFPTLHLALIGGELAHLPEPGKLALARLQAEFGDRIEVVGFTTDVAGWLARTTLVVGAGRVAIEALGAARPVLALGEASYAGIVTEATFAAAAASNFGDISAQVASSKVDFQGVLADARAFLRQPTPVAPALQAQVRAHYGLARVADAVLEVYQAARMKKVCPSWLPVLMYHKIPDVPPATKHRIFVTKEHFTRHLTFFKRRGFTLLTFADYLQFARAERSLSDFPPRPLILTFDDGYLDNYTNLLPLMQQHGYRGVLYLLGDPALTHNRWDTEADPTEPRAELMTFPQKQAFVAAGWEIGAHTQSHPRLSTLPLPAATREISQSKAALEADLQTTIQTFAYPYGDLNSDLKTAVRAAGFALGIATDTGGLHLEDDRMQVFRVNMFPHETVWSLFKKTSSWYRAYYRRKRDR